MRRAVSGMGGLRLIPPPPGEGGRVAAGWGLRFKRKPYRFKDTFEFTIDLVITEPEYPVSKAAQSFIPEIVPPSVIVKSMLMSIYLGHEPRASALNVNDVRRDRRLTPKMVTNCAQFTKLDPELTSCRVIDLRNLRAISFAMEEPHPAAARPPSPSGRDKQNHTLLG